MSLYIDRNIGRFVKLFPLATQRLVACSLELDCIVKICFKIMFHMSFLFSFNYFFYNFNSRVLSFILPQHYKKIIINKLCICESIKTTTTTKYTTWLKIPWNCYYANLVDINCQSLEANVSDRRMRSLDDIFFVKTSRKILLETFLWSPLRMHPMYRSKTKQNTNLT